MRRPGGSNADQAIEAVRAPGARASRASPCRPPGSGTPSTGRPAGSARSTAWSCTPRAAACRSKAKAKAIYHTVYAVNYYTGRRSHGCHYVNGWRGVAGRRPAPDRQRARAGQRGRRRRPAALDRPGPLREGPARRRGRAVAGAVAGGRAPAPPAARHPDRQLLLRARRVRALRLATRSGGSPTPRRCGRGCASPGAQHEAVALLACDIARRNGWPLRSRRGGAPPGCSGTRT